MKIEHLNEIKGIIILAITLIVLASLVSFTPHDLPWFSSTPFNPTHNWVGIAGAYCAGILFFGLGYSAYFLVIIGVFLSWNKFVHRDIQFSILKSISLVILFVVMATLLALTGSEEPRDHFLRGGAIGLGFGDFLVTYWSRFGAFMLLITIGALALVVTGEFLLSGLVMALWRKSFQTAKGAVDKVSQLPKPKIPSIGMGKKIEEKPLPKPSDKLKKPIVPVVVEKQAPVKAEIKEPKAQAPNIHIVKEEPAAKAADLKPKVVGEYHLPSVDLLNDPPIVTNSQIQEDLMKGSRILEETLSDFGVNVKVADIERGPVITCYELQPAPGVKVGSIINLADDLALALSAPAVRIVAPIPGKNRVGVEVPNGSSAAVYLKDLLVASQFRDSKSKLTLAIGKDISGKPLVADLADMPHLLIAGTTGSGKSVCLNSLVMSILFNASPAQVKFIMIDPKMVEMVLYNDLPHLICPVITDVKKATAALNWVVGEMESRYRALSKEQVRNIKGYHEKGFEMPYIVVVIDELADLMQVSAKSVEGAIARLAQLARAVGIHLILATQRPSVDVITGVIKANFPARLSFKVASKVDSRTVLDANGAEDLLGKGDLLFARPSDPKPTRGQCCWVSDAEMSRVIDFIKQQANPEYNESVVKPQTQAQGGVSDEKDEMYDQAVRVIIETNQASVTILQRRLRLGYSRAARLIDMMEQQGIVGAYAGSKPRDILIDREKWLIENTGKTQEVQPNDSQPTA